MMESYLTLEKIKSLIDLRIPENLYLEYKSEINLAKDSDKKEFLADISAFSNSNGGNIIFGVKSKDGIPTEIDGINCDNIDKLIQTIEQLMNSCIQPKIINYKIDTIEINKSNYLLIIILDKSWNSPHMVNHSKDTKFYLRDNNGKHPMSIDEIRFAFKFSDSLAEKIRDFHTVRIQNIINDKLQFVFPKKPFMCIS